VSLRVLQVCQKPQLRGAEVFAHHLNAALRAAGHCAATAYLYPGPRAAALPLAEGDAVLDGRELSAFDALVGVEPRLLHALRALVRDLRPDVLQLNGGRAVKYGALAREEVVRGRGVLIYRNIGHPGDWVHGWRRRWFYRRLVWPRMDGVATVMDATRTFMERACPQAVHAVIPTAVNPDALIPSAPRAEVRRLAAIPPDAPVVLFIGSLSREKRPFWLLDAFRRLRGGYPSARLWFVGDGPQRRELERDAGAPGLAGAVTFWGARLDAATFLGAADVLALSSVTEGVPAVVLEAGLFRLPVVATRVGGVSECVLHGETGVLVDRDDAVAFSDALGRLLGDHALRHRLGQAAAEWTRRCFTMDRAAQSYAGFYQRVRQTKWPTGRSASSI
jgi:glycosyltransferase involved in cell wall biosynthesis